jgi:hypothetical protein
MRNHPSIPQTVVHPVHGGEAGPMLFLLAVAAVASLLVVILNPPA